MGGGLIVICFLLVPGFSLTLESNLLLRFFGFVMSDLMASALLNVSKNEPAMVARSAVGVILYMLMVTGVIFLPVPQWGITTTVRGSVYTARDCSL